MNLLNLLAGLFTGKAGESIGGAVSIAAQVASVAAVVGPAALWLTSNKDQVFITLTYGDLAFWCSLIAGQIFVIVRLVHRAPPP